MQKWVLRYWDWNLAVKIIKNWLKTKQNQNLLKDLSNRLLKQLTHEQTPGRSTDISEHPPSKKPRLQQRNVSSFGISQSTTKQPLKIFNLPLRFVLTSIDHFLVYWLGRFKPVKTGVGYDRPTLQQKHENFTKRSWSESKLFGTLIVFLKESLYWKKLTDDNKSMKNLLSMKRVNPLPHRATFNTFANRAEPDQIALVRAAWSGSTLYAYGDMIRYDPTLVDLTSNFFVLCTNMKVYLYNYS